MTDEGGFTSAVRLELASLPVPSQREARAELAGMLLVGVEPSRIGRMVHDLAGLRPGDLPLARLCADEQMIIDVPTSAMARRAMAIVHGAMGLRARLTAVSTTARRPHGPAYRVSVPLRAVQERESAPGRRATPRPSSTDDTTGGPPEAEMVALVRGVVLLRGSFSSPGRAVHVEVSGVPDGLAPLLLAALEQLVPGADPNYDQSRRRLVVKSGATTADLLAILGATRAFLTFDDRRLRRQLRGEANRMANADAANLARVARSAGAQVDAIERAVDREGWDVFGRELRDVALARLANPSASIGELAELLGMTRTTLHRRLGRLEEVARAAVEGPPTPVEQGPSASVDDAPLPPRTKSQEDAP